MTNLTSQGKLTKTNKTKISDIVGKGSPEYLWKLTKAEDKQLELL